MKSLFSSTCKHIHLVFLVALNILLFYITFYQSENEKGIFHLLFFLCLFFFTFPYQCWWLHFFIAILSRKFYFVLSQYPSLPLLLFIFLIVGTDLARTKVIGRLEQTWVTRESGHRKKQHSCIKKYLNYTKTYSYKLFWSWGVGRKTYMVRNRLQMEKWEKVETVMESKMEKKKNHKAMKER